MRAYKLSLIPIQATSICEKYFSCQNDYIYRKTEKRRIGAIDGTAMLTGRVFFIVSSLITLIIFIWEVSNIL